jgi:protein ImuB
VADARALVANLEVRDDDENLSLKLLQHIAEWCIRFSPVAATDVPDGILLDATGCAHLWGGEEKYVTEIFSRFRALGYSVRICMSDTIGMAWAAARYKRMGNFKEGAIQDGTIEEGAIKEIVIKKGKIEVDAIKAAALKKIAIQSGIIIEPGAQMEAIMDLPPEALRIDPVIAERLHQLGLERIGEFISMPQSALRRRFGQQIIHRLNQALGSEAEFMEPVVPPEPYQDRLTSFEPVATRAGIEMALEQLLDKLCSRLSKEGKGIRSGIFTCYRVDNKKQSIDIKTIKPSFHAWHLFKLFENRIGEIEPALGIELFVLTANKVEDIIFTQEAMWNGTGGLQDTHLSELLDRLSGRFGSGAISRYLPQEHYWPERSFKMAVSLDEKAAIDWGSRPRPLQLLTHPEKIEVTSLIPDYPPMLFRYKGQLHKVVKADGPERIEQEWWLQKGMHRDYYCVEDVEGRRYWVFRSGHYDGKKKPQWFIHGFFA